MLMNKDEFQLKVVLLQDDNLNIIITKQILAVFARIEGNRNSFLDYQQFLENMGKLFTSTKFYGIPIHLAALL